MNLDDSFEEDTRNCIAKHVHQMLQIDPSSRPSASSLLIDFINYCQPSNSTQGSYIEIHHEFNPNRQLDSCTDVTLTTTSTIAGISYIEISDDCTIVSESVSSLSAKEAQLSLSPDYITRSNFTQPTMISQAQQSPGILNTLNLIIQGNDQNGF